MTLRTKEHLTTHLGLSACQVLRASRGVQERGVWVIPGFQRLEPVQYCAPQREICEGNGIPEAFQIAVVRLGVVRQW